MERKELLKIITDLKTTDFDQLFKLCGASSHTAQKQIRRMLFGFAKDGRIEVLSETGQIRVPTHLLEKKKKSDGDKPESGKSHDKKSSDNKKKRLHYTDAKSDYNAVVSKYELRTEFPSKVLKESEEISKTIPESEIRNRLDLRKSLVVTIDGADAKDLDDAISLDKTPKGWRLGVHIADVSHYVPMGSKLDREALQRANSFYFVNRVIPMFPEVLSNGQCSLNPNEDKLTLSIFISLDKTGKTLGSEIRETVIKTRHRLNYDEVDQFFTGKKSFGDPELESTLNEMRELYKILYTHRIEDGSIDFDFKEQKIQLDDNGEPVRVWLKDRLDSERLIEEFMLLANKNIARYLSAKGAAIYRIHEEPSEEKFADFARMVMRFGHKLEGLPVAEPKEIQRLLFDVQNKPHKELVSQMLLRSMSQARYDTDNLGHFGLGFEYYTHFTSPIRRYADLVVHRLVKNSLQRGKKKEIYDEEQLEEISNHISTVERTAVDAERDFYKMKAVRYMQDKVGNIYDGIITGIMMVGMFVQISEIGVEGMARFVDMDDYYIYETGEISTRGKRSSQRFTIGDKIRIKVLKVNIERGFLDFAVQGHEEEKFKRNKRH